MKNQLTKWTKFDNPILNEIKEYGGSPDSVIIQLKIFKNVGMCYYKYFGIIEYNKFIKTFTAKDKEIIKLISLNQ